MSSVLIKCPLPITLKFGKFAKVEIVLAWKQKDLFDEPELLQKFLGLRWRA